MGADPFGFLLNVAIPNEADINAPHVFQGTNGDVIVAESSSVLDKFLGASFRFLNSVLNIYPFDYYLQHLEFPMAAHNQVLIHLAMQILHVLQESVFS